MTPAPLRNDFGKIDGSFGPFVSLQGKDFGDGSIILGSVVIGKIPMTCHFHRKALVT